MKNNLKKVGIFLSIALALAGLASVLFTIFFDQAVLVRKGTFFKKACFSKLVALTFDDGPSDVWTPKILDELKKANVRATFFMTGVHAEKYSSIARRVADEGHEIGNHSFDHHVLLSYTPVQLKKEIRQGEEAIRNATGKTTEYFRPPKAWITNEEKREIKRMGYTVVLWDLNSKDWVTFDDKYIMKYILRHIRAGDIILFHDSGGVFSTEGGDRSETVKTIPRLVEKLKEKGYKFVTITELLHCAQ